MSKFYRFPDKIINLDNIISLQVNEKKLSIILIDIANDMHSYKFKDEYAFRNFVLFIDIRQQFNDDVKDVFDIEYNNHNEDMDDF